MRRRRRGLETEPLPIPAGPGALVVWYEPGLNDVERAQLADDVVSLRAHLLGMDRPDVMVVACNRNLGIEYLDEGAMLVAGWRKVRPARPDAPDQA